MDGDGRPLAWAAQSAIYHGASPTGVGFDPQEERVWVTDTDGFLTSYTLGDQQLYSATRVAWFSSQDDANWAITSSRAEQIRPIVSASGVVCVTGPNVRFYDRGGCLESDVLSSAFSSSSGPSTGPAASAAAATRDYRLTCGVALDSFDSHGVPSTGRLLLGGRTPDPSLHVIDTTRFWRHDAASLAAHRYGSAISGHATKTAVRSLATFSVSHPVNCLGYSSSCRALVAGYSDGPDVTLFDAALRNTAPIGKLTGHSGGMLSVDAARSVVVSCGYTDAPSGSGPSRRPSPDPSLRVYDTRMLRLLTTISLPAVGRYGGPVFVKFLPEQQDTNLGSPPVDLLVGTADGRLFTCDPTHDRLLSPLAALDPAACAMHRASMRGEAYVPTPESQRIRITHMSLAPSAASVAMCDSEGIIHVVAPAPGMTTSQYGGLSVRGITAHVTEPWIQDREEMWADGGASLVDATAEPSIASRVLLHATAITEAAQAAANGASTEGAVAAAVTVAARMGHIDVNSPLAAAMLARVGAAAAAASGGGSAAASAAAASAVVSAVTGGAGPATDAELDTAFDAVLVQGLGGEVPVSAPGVASLKPLLPRTEWENVWSTSLSAVTDPTPSATAAAAAAAVAAGKSGEEAAAAFTNDITNPKLADLWGDCADGTWDRRGGYRGSAAASAASSSGTGLIPAYHRVSTFPPGYNAQVMVPNRFKEIDPLLLSLADKTGTHISNRAAALRLRPNSLLFGSRRGYVNPDPRRREENRSTLRMESGRGRERSGSIDSNSTDDLERMIRGDDLLSDDENEDAEEDDAAGGDSRSVNTEISVQRAHAAAGSPTARSAWATPGAAADALSPWAGHVPRAYRRPRLVATRFGFFDLDFTAFNSSNFAGLEEVGPNSFVNAALQLLVFVRGLRRKVQSHLCSHPHCASCEVRFIFDQLSQGAMMPEDARVASAANFIRTLGFITEMRSLGVLHPCTIDAGRRMEAFLRALLDKMNKELAGGHAEREIIPMGLLPAGNTQAGGKPKWIAAAPLPAAPTASSGGHGHGHGHVHGNRGNRHAAPAPAAVSATDAPEGTPEAVFGLRMLHITTCPAGHTTTRTISSSHVDLMYPEGKPPASASPAAVAAALSFSGVLQSSLNSSRKTKAWCEECKGYVLLTQTRTVQGLPPVLMINANVPATSDAPVRASWRASVDAASAAGKQWVAPALAITTASTATTAAAVRDLTGHTDPNGFLQASVATMLPPTPAGSTTGLYELVGVLVHVASPAPRSRKGQQVKLGHTATAGGAASGAAQAAASATAAASAGGKTDKQLEAQALANYHYVSCMRVSNEGCTAVSGLPQPGAGSSTGGAGHKGGNKQHAAADMWGHGAGTNDGSKATGRGQWMLFNDFRVRKSSLAEVCDFRSPAPAAYKTPCILLYQRTDYEADAGIALRTAHLSPAEQARVRLSAGYLYPHPTNPCPMAADVLRVPPSVYTLAPSIPHQPMLGQAPPNTRLVDAVPPEGSVVAMDAEFVATATEHARVLADGQRRVIAQARLMPGRLSIMLDTDPEGRKTGTDAEASTITTVFDDYIAASEPVVDHLTRWSGIVPGDLDTTTSAHRLVTYKDTYMKLRALIDGGCVFVGHGLKKDCRELGVFIPATQILDTVRLYKLEGQRYLSLRFLAAHVLGRDIQGTVHDSTEDALMSLLLYKHYQALSATAGGEESIRQLLHELYDMGRSTGWRAHTDGSKTRTLTHARTVSAVSSAAPGSGGPGATAAASAAVPSAAAPVPAARRLSGAGEDPTYMTPSQRLALASAVGFAQSLSGGGGSAQPMPHSVAASHMMPGPGISGLGPGGGLHSGNFIPAPGGIPVAGPYAPGPNYRHAGGRPGRGKGMQQMPTAYGGGGGGGGGPLGPGGGAARPPLHMTAGSGMPGSMGGYHGGGGGGGGLVAPPPLPPTGPAAYGRGTGPGPYGENTYAAHVGGAGGEWPGYAGPPPHGMHAHGSLGPEGTAGGGGGGRYGGTAYNNTGGGGGGRQGGRRR